MCNHSSSDTDLQEEYSPLSVEEYSTQSIENYSPSSDDFDPQEEDSQMSVEEYLPQLVEDDSPLLDDSNPHDEYSPLLVEDYSPQSIEIYSPLSDEMSTEEITIEEYTPGTLEDDESQQSPSSEMDEATIEWFRNYEKQLAEFIKKLEGENSDGSVTEIESRDVNFLENEFPKRGEVDRDIQFYELDNLIEDSNLNALLKVNVDLSGTSVPNGSKTPLQVNIDLPGPSIPSGRNEVVETTLLDLPSRRSNHGNVPRLRFEIEWETFMIEEMCNHSSSDTDLQEEYLPLSVEEYSTQSIENHSPSSNDFDPQEEDSQMSVEEYSPQLVEDDSPLLDDSNPHDEYSPLLVEDYSPQSVEIYSPLSDEMSTEEITIEEYTPGTLEDDESQQSPRSEMDEATIEWFRNYEKQLAEFIKKLEGENSDGSVTEIESRDVNFLENEFPKRGEVDRDIQFYELDNLIEDSNLNALLKVNVDLSGTSVPNGSKTPLQVNIDLPGPSIPSGRNEVVETTLLDLPSRRSNHGNVPRLRFEIEWETFMIEEMCNHSSSDTDLQEEYLPLSVEEYSTQSIENHSPSSNDFDPQEEDSQMSVEEYSPQLVEDDSPLLDDSNPHDEYSPLLVEDYSPQSVEIYSPLSDEMSTEEITIEEYTPGTLEDDESQQSPRSEMDEATIEWFRNYEKQLAEFIKKLEGENSDGSVTEIESRDVNFLENEFPKRGEVDRDIQFYELDNLIEDSNLNALLKVNVDLSGTSVPNGSKTPLQVNIDLPGPSIPSGRNEVVETTL
ncbi:hypothetical protein LWI28_011275 [Acer negundo]|uniref:Uncharacterized protein n=1 Tax=Acer negundo TaxID=4023 RepID=A0AAD5J5E1_ACENE|nr:hypothetical protein LWI28_011275 [Acer negundo]